MKNEELVTRYDVKYTQLMSENANKEAGPMEKMSADLRRLKRFK